MADIKFSEFPKANQSKDSDEIAILQDGVNKMIPSPVLESKIINKTVSRVIDQGGASLNLINLKGVVTTYSDLSTITPTPELNDAYQVESDGLVYIYTETGFQAVGEGFNLLPKPNGVVEEGNIESVSGGEVYNKINPISNIVNGISETITDLNSLPTGQPENLDDTRYSYSDFIEIYPNSTLSYSLRGSGMNYIQFFNSKKVIISHKRSTSLAIIVGNNELPPEGTKYVRFSTMNRTHPNNGNYNFYFKYFTSGGILNKIDGLENDITANSEDLLFIKNILNNSVVDYNKDDWGIGSFTNSQLTTYNMSPFYETQGFGKLHYSLLHRGVSDYLRTYDANYNIVRVLTGDSSNTKNYVGVLDLNEDEVYFRATVMNSGHSNYIPYDYMLEIRYIDINTNDPINYYDGLKSFSSDYVGNNLAIKAIKIYNIENQSPYYKDVLWNDTVTDEFYISKDVNSIRTKIFKFNSTISNGDSGVYSAFILPNGDILFVYRTEFAGGSTPLESTRKNPILYVAENNYEPIVIDFGGLNKPSGWLQNVGAMYSKRYNRFYISEYTRGNVPSARVWAVDMPLTDPQNWNIALERNIPTPYASGFKHFHTVQEDPYTGILYASSGDSPTESFVWYSLDGGDTFIQLDDPSHAKWRMLNMVFLPDAIYWASDDWREAHRFWKIERGVDGVMDINTLTQILVFPYEVTAEDYNRIATYASVFLECYNSILFLDRDDSGYTSHIPVRLYDLETETLHDIGKVEDLSAGAYGFRCETVDIYPKDNKVTISFGKRYGNNTNILGGGGSSQLNALEMIITKNDNKYILTYKEL